MTDLDALLGRLAAEGVHVSAEGDRLAVDGPVADEDLAVLRAHKAAVLARLRPTAPGTPRPTPGARRTRPVLAPPRRLGAVLADVLREAEQGPPWLLPTPWPGLTQALGGGLARGELLLVGGRPGTGKTILGLQLARHAAGRGVGVLCLSREMSDAALGARYLAQAAHVSALALRMGRLTADDRRRMVEAARQASALALWLDAQTAAIDAVAERLATWTETPAPTLLVVDYLQLMRAPRTIRDRRLQVEYVSATLKAFALQHGLVVVALSSLARPATGHDARPTLASLRESGELEHDADSVVLLHDPDPLAPVRQIEWLLAKNRHGRLGRGVLRLRADTVAFEEPAERQPGEEA